MYNPKRRHVKERTKIIRHVRSTSPKNIRQPKKDIDTGGGGGNTASSVNNPVVPEVDSKVRNGFKQSQGKFNSVEFNRNVQSGNAFQFQPPVNKLNEGLKNKSYSFNYQNKLPSTMSNLALAASPLNGTSNDKAAGIAAADLYMNKGIQQEETLKNLEIVQGMWSGKYSYGVDQKEWDAWFKQAYKNTGEYITDKDGNFVLDENGNKQPEYVLRPDAPPPPMGTDEATYERWLKKNTYTAEVQDEDGNWVEQRFLNEDAEEAPITTKDFVKYWNWYTSYNNHMTEENKRAKERSYHMAGLDPNLSDSMLDVLRDTINGTDKDPIAGTIHYFDNYYWNPLKQGDFGMVFMNTLVNLGETMDVFGVGTRAVIASNDALKYSGQKIFEGQYEFVYSGGDDLQKKLMELGADRLLFVSKDLETRRRGQGGLYSPTAASDKIEASIKDAGLWDEYLKLKDEWEHHDNQGSALENLKKAYTDPSANFNVNTGSFGTDMLLETVLDPSLILGGLSNGLAKGGSRAIAKETLEAAVKRYGSKEVLDFIGSGNKAVKQYIKNAGAALLTEDKGTIRRGVRNLADTLLKNNLIDEASSSKFIDVVTNAIDEVKGSRQYNFVRSMSKANAFIDGLDSVLLKTSFVVPYTPFAAVSRLRKTLRNNSKIANWVGLRKGLREKQAMSELFKEFANKDGVVNIGSLNDILNRVADDVNLRANPEFTTRIINAITGDMKTYMGDLGQLSDQLAKGGFSPDEFDELLNRRIREVSNNRLKSVDDLSDYIDDVFNSHSYQFSGQLDDIKKIVVQQIKDIDEIKSKVVNDFVEDFYKDLSRSVSVEDIQDLILRVRRFNNSLDEPDAFNNAILQRVYDLNMGNFNSTDDFIRQFELKNSRSFNKGSSVITDILSNMDNRSKYLNTMHPKMKESFEDLAHYFYSVSTVFNGGSYTNATLLDLLFKDGKVVNISDVNPRDLHAALTEVIQESQLKMITKNYEGDIDFEKAVIDKLVNFDSELIDVQLGVVTSETRDLLDVHCDLFNVFNKYTSDTRYIKFLDYLTQNKELESGLTDLSIAMRRFKEVVVKPNNLPIEDYSPFERAIVKMRSVFYGYSKQKQALDAYNRFCVNLRQIPDITEDQFWTIQDALFGFSLNNPEDFYVKSSRNMEALINKINLNSDTLFGESRVSLDGFRTDARNFSSDLWKDYSDEISDPVIQRRVDNMLSSGHLNPDKDVDVQMLQLILRDKGAVDYYNNLAKSQDVLFLDIETQGTNSGIHKITDISYKKWEPDVISKDSSLDEILTYIENRESKRYTTKYPSSEIDKALSTDTLKYLFKDEPNAGRAEWLRKYKEVYASAGPDDIVTEERILKDLMLDMDKSFDASGGKSPVLVTHSNRGFDVNFIRDRAYYYKTQNINLFPAHIAHMQDILNASESTVERLKSKTGDIILTSAQASAVKDSIRTLGYDMPSGLHDFRFLDVDLDSVHSAVDNFNDASEFVGNFFYKYGSMFDPSLEEVYYDLVNIFKSDNFTKELDELDQLGKDVFYDTSRFNGNFLFDPNPESSLFEAAFKASDNGSIPEVGYRKVGMDTSKYFDTSVIDFVSYDVVTKMTDFTKSVDKIVLTQLKQNTLLEKYYDEFRSIIQYAIDYAQELQPHDPFSYFKYLSVPETVYETYAIAQVIWDNTLKYVNENTISYIKELNSNVTVDMLRDNVRDYILDFAMSGNTFNLNVSDACLGILKGDSDEFIYKYAKPDQYYPKFTEPLADVKAFNQVQSEIDSHLKAGAAYSAIAEKYYDQASDYAMFSAQKNMSDIADLLKEIEGDLDAGVTSDGMSLRLANMLNVLKDYHSKRRYVMSSQILNYVSKSEDNLISHLLFHNHQLHVPVDFDSGGVNLLRELLYKSSDDAPYFYKECNGYIHVGIKKDVKLRILNDSRYVDEAATVKIDGSDKIYTAPEYGIIEFDSAEPASNIDLNLYVTGAQVEDTMEEIVDQKALDRVKRVFELMEDIYKHVDFLTEGKSAGSVGTLHTLDRQHKLYQSLPKDFVDNLLSEDISCDARFWHQASFDFSCLGDSEHVWKVTDFNDADPLLSLFHTIQETTGSATAERMYLGYYDNVDSPFKISNMLQDVTDEEKISILRNLDDMAIVNFNSVSNSFPVRTGIMESRTGVEVTALDIKDLTDLKRAEASGAILVPYDVFLDMQEVFNKSTVTSTFLKGWCKMMWLYKVGQLANPGTWTRNWIDATMKMTADVGSAGETARYQLKAAYMLMNYKTISRKIQKLSGLNYTTAVDVEREFNRLPKRLTKNMTYEEYKFIDDWLQISIAGGESRTLKSVKDYTNSAVNLNVALKKGDTSGRTTQSLLDQMKQEYDLVGSKIQRFEELGEDEIMNLISSSKRKLWRKMSKERFLQIVREGQEIATNDELIDYNDIVNELIEQRFKKLRNEGVLSETMNRICETTFKPMSGVEEIIRFAEYIALEEQGCTRNQIFKTIVSSQFNYDNKTMRAKMLEMFIPYYGFMDANLNYWLKSLDRNPRMLRYVQHIWGNLSWDAAFQYGEDPESNGSVNYMMAHGGIPIGSSGMYLKTEPSFIQPLSMMLGSPSEYVNTLATPFQYSIRALLNSGAKEYSVLLHEITEMNQNASGFEQFLSALPIYGTLSTRYFEHFTEKKTWERLTGDGNIERFLVKYNPSLFGAVKRMQTDKEWTFELYQKQLAEQGKWYDQNLQKVVPIEQMNTDGLNDPDLPFDERVRLIFIKRNKLWDANQGTFVDVGQYRPGGLNREFDLENPEEWDELCKLKERYLQQKWDYNKRKWVPIEEWEPTMLNDPNISWEDNQRYHEELYGEKYDYNQGKYVQKDQYIPGGLNSEPGTLSFEEICALQYALHGKEYVKGEGFVKTREPIVNFDTPDFDLDKTVELDRSDPKVKALSMLGLLDVAYAGEYTPIEKSVSKVEGRWVLNGDPKHDAAVFKDIIANYAKVLPGYREYGRYVNWKGSTWDKYYKGYGEYSDLPKLPDAVRHVINTGNKRRFSNPYTSGGEYAALRMALYGTKIYEDYYRNEFSYNYNYRSPSAGPKRYFGSLYHEGQYQLTDKKFKSQGKWKYYNR